MKIGSNGLDLIKNFEGLYLKSYKCPAGVWTIGYGTTGDDVFEGLKITQEQAESELVGDIDSVCDHVEQDITFPLSDNQFSAVVSLVYNIGISAFLKSTILQKLNKGDISGSAKEFMRWNKIKGVASPGLTRRRKAEMDLFLKV